jgi:uncharacterized protein
MWKGIGISMLLLALFTAGVEIEAADFAATKAKAEKGDAGAQFNLGKMYDFGHGVTKDEAEAVKWYRMAV